MPTNPQPIVAVIDRDRVTAYGLALLLHDWGYETVVGASAPEIFGRSEAMGRRIDAIVADDRSSNGVAAPTEAAVLAELAHRAIPTVVLVTRADAASAEELRRRGFASVPKPIEPNALRDLLRSMVSIAP